MWLLKNKTFPPGKRKNKASTRQHLTETQKHWRWRWRKNIQTTDTQTSKRQTAHANSVLILRIQSPSETLRHSSLHILASAYTTLTHPHKRHTLHFGRHTHRKRERASQSRRKTHGHRGTDGQSQSQQQFVSLYALLCILCASVHWFFLCVSCSWSEKTGTKVRNCDDKMSLYCNREL